MKLPGPDRDSDAYRIREQGRANSLDQLTQDLVKRKSVVRQFGFCFEYFHQPAVNTAT